MDGDTIFAVSSGHPPAAIAVIRISGAGALTAAAALAGTLPPARRAGLRALRDGDGALLDRALVLPFPGPATATGEDLVELHCHGGRAVVAAVERALGCLPGLRRAAPGEFTRRALLHGRIDLAEAQGLADLLQAETEAQRLAALGGSEGRISALVNDWLERLTRAAAAVEASLDFSDEGDVGESDDALARVRAAVADLAGEIGSVVARPPVERIKDGVRVVIAGPPNAGKSTLFNHLCGRDAAIVSPVAGTTRDRVEAPVQRGGVAYLLIDTAGLNEGTTDEVEEEGMARAAQAAATADVLIWLADTPPPRGDALWVHGRSDLAGRRVMPAGPALAVTEHDGSAVAALWDAIGRTAAPLVGRSGEVALHQHQREACLDAGRSLTPPRSDPLILAEQLRAARGALGQITGASATEAMLEMLFGQFCIGK